MVISMFHKGVNMVNALVYGFAYTRGEDGKSIGLWIGSFKLRGYVSIYKWPCSNVPNFGQQFV